MIWVLYGVLIMGKQINVATPIAFKNANECIRAMNYYRNSLSNNSRRVEIYCAEAKVFYKANN